MKHVNRLLALAAFAIGGTAAFAQTTVPVVVGAPEKDIVISKHIYGHFSEHLGHCIYDGFWVNENLNVPKKDRIRLDIVDALKKIKIPNLRWPGGCFADEYHWRDGIGPRKQRPVMINTNWGNVTEDNSFGTHEFLELCSLLGTEPYITGNVGSGTVEEMSKWVEYLNFDGVSPVTGIRKQNGHEKPFNVSFWGVGNESWGCGGNMSPEFYASQFKRYATFCKNYPNAQLKKIASGPNVDDYRWTETLMKEVPSWLMWGLSLHYYTVPKDWGNKGSATQFDEKEYFTTMQKCLYMDELVTKHSAIMDKYDPKKHVSLVVDEWGIWTNVEPGTNGAFLYQQNSMRDALVAATTLNIFNNHADRVRMANLAQTINVLQALVLTDKEKMLLTPTYHVFDLYQVHQNAHQLKLHFASPDYSVGDQKIPAVNGSASQDSSGAIHISLVNLDASKKISISALLPANAGAKVSARVLTAAAFNSYNSFDEPNKVVPAAFSDFKKDGSQLAVTLPPISVVVLTIQ
ncbi:alpha-N-arabinofuranosidase [Deminuibacter soli]|uniref:non-reducing end alpha-L-arabinofuranosidase n=1 Tax=Deminuibacter soli TaxID=2291815 RepID=A0A3E1NCE2_9BACT|nr:alpha-L-arabinofuranosidase C-terminal domain-containing protein [Deminuibacter soli]RFM25623.1 alpha-N-arabinofuranosidase [Deminuibacter soli]